ncbi:unnamed protein product [Cylindrotheca closterium]|uniref:DNA replication complex GINS protein SLD5 n=1 Tax=Cylindrotheca closterium TaxID=2856 RepID=A0AAD2CIJ9_9STRA|nr:unnamed protein product [Cylindrotheca closterium]
MADLYNLLGELDHREDEEQDFFKGRPSAAGTEATAEQSEWGSPSRSPNEAEVPLVLQQAHRDKDIGAEEDFGQDLLHGEEDMLVENDLYTKLHRHWFQERHCPELLEFDEDMAQDIKTHLEDRRDWVEQQEGVTDAVEDLMVTLTQMDTDRVKFVFSDWLTRRLAKIEAHPLYMREQIDHMSDGELRYLKSYGELYESHLRNTVLDHVPEAWQRLDEENMIDKPDYDSYHFWLAKEAIDKHGTHHEKGTCLVAKYKDMREMMIEGKVDLQM